MGEYRREKGGGGKRGKRKKYGEEGKERKKVGEGEWKVDGKRREGRNKGGKGRREKDTSLEMVITPIRGG